MKTAVHRYLGLFALFVLALSPACGDNARQPGSHAITAFSFSAADNPALASDVTATISGDTIAATVPAGTDVTALKARFTTDGAHVLVGTAEQTSGVTPNNFTTAVAYTVVAADGGTETYSATVTVAKSTAKELTALSFLAANNTGLATDVTATINGNAIAATVPFGTDVTALKATFTTTGTSVSVAGVAQVSSVTANDFTSAVTYEVTAADASKKDYTVTVTIAANTAKELTAFGFTSALNSGAGITSDVTATITGTTVGITVPYATNVTGLIATFSTTGTNVKVGTVTQTSGTTANDFTSDVAYVVSAADGSTKTYTVHVTVALNPAKELTSFKLTSALNSAAGITADVIGTINGTTIGLTVPYGTDVTGLVATYTTTGASVKVGTTTQASGVTANNFSSDVIYVVTAADGTTKSFTVQVAVALNPAKEITAFSFTSALNAGAGVSSDAIATITGTDIAIKVPYGTNPSNLIATFQTTGASVAIAGTAQTSGITANDFTSDVTYTVTAADGTTKDFVVHTTVALNPAKDLTSFVFTSALNGLSADVTGTFTGTQIDLTVPYGTDVTHLIASFTTTGASVAIGGTAQASGVTQNNFTTDVTYTVTAADSSTKDYTVHVAIALNPAKDITSFAFLSANNGAYLTSDVAGSITGTTITVYVPYGTDVTNLVATFQTTGASVAIGTIAQASGVTANDYTTALTYTVTAADGTTKGYTVTVSEVSYATANLYSYGYNGYSVGTKQLVFLFAPSGTAFSSNADYAAYCEGHGFEQNLNSDWYGSTYQDTTPYQAAQMVSATDYYCQGYCCYLGYGNQQASNLSNFQNHGLPLGTALQVFDRGCGDYGGSFNYGLETTDTLNVSSTTNYSYNPNALGSENYAQPKTTKFSQDGVVVCQAR